jgi:hypothetical protein
MIYDPLLSNENLIENDIKENNINENNINEKIPQSILNFLTKENYTLVRFKGIKSIQKVKCAHFNMVKNNNFSFEFEEKENFYFFIVKQENENYIKKNQENNLRKTFFKNENIEIPLGIFFDFDYNKYNFYAILGRIDENKEFKYDKNKKLLLNREICSVRHTTYEGINFFKLTKKIEPPIAKQKFNSFPNCLEKYYLIEIETKKLQKDTTIREDGVISILYLLSSTMNKTYHLFIMIKYTLYFIKETLINYIGKYIHDIIYDFCNLPNEILIDFLSHIGAMNSNVNETKIIYPIRNQVKTIMELNRKNMIHFTYRNLPNIKRPKAVDKIPFHKFIQLYEKYNMFHQQDEFKIKKSKIEELQYLKDCLKIEKGDNITREHKVNLKKLLEKLFKDLTNSLNYYMNNNTQSIKRYMMESINRFLIQYISFKGFFNIDIVINEESMFELQCYKNKNKNQKMNENIFYCVTKTLNFINSLFEFNEGFFHKHYSILDFSYNFNEKNVIHTFPCCNDSSKKNKIRIFDIPFLDKWNFHIATLIMLVYKDLYGFLNNNSNFQNEEYQENSQNKFFNLFSETHDLISKELFQYYEIVLPNYYSLCDRMSKYPLDKYNCIDSVCQHFTNISLEILLRNNLPFFCPFNSIYNIKVNDIFNRPKLNSIFEPYLMLVDNELKNFLEKKENKEEYLKKNNYDIKSYFQDLKKINNEKLNHSIFLTNQVIDEDEEIEYEKENNNNNNDDEIITTIPPNNTLKKLSIKKYKVNPYNYNNNKSFDFYYLFNLYYFFTYKTMFELKQKFFNYDTMKGYIDFLESSISISYNKDNSLLDNAPKDVEKNKVTKKEIKNAIIKDLKKMHKLNKMVRVMNYIFMDYLKHVVNDIMLDPNSGWTKKENENEYYYMKIGHYLVNFALYGKNNKTTLEEFSQSDFYKNSGI